METAEMVVLEQETVDQAKTVDQADMRELVALGLVLKVALRKAGKLEEKKQALHDAMQERMLRAGAEHISKEDVVSVTLNPAYTQSRLDGKALERDRPEMAERAMKESRYTLVGVR